MSTIYSPNGKSAFSFYIYVDFVDFADARNLSGWLGSRHGEVARRSHEGGAGTAKNDVKLACSGANAALPHPGAPQRRCIHRGCGAAQAIGVSDGPAVSAGRFNHHAGVRPHRRDNGGVHPSIAGPAMHTIAGQDKSPRAQRQAQFGVGLSRTGQAQIDLPPDPRLRPISDAGIAAHRRAANARIGGGKRIAARRCRIAKRAPAFKYPQRRALRAKRGGDGPQRQDYQQGQPQYRHHPPFARGGTICKAMLASWRGCVKERAAVVRGRIASMGLVFARSVTK